MTVSTTDNRVQFDGDGSSIEFPFTFGIFDEDDLDVILTSSTGVNTTLTRGVDYDVTLTTPDDLPSIGMIEFIGLPDPTPPALGEMVTIIRLLDYTQEIDITDGGPLAASSLNEAHDRAVMLVQQLKELLGRSVTLPVTSAVSGLTISDPEAGTALVWNDDEDGLTNLNLSTIGAIAVSTLGQALIDDETATAMLTTLGIDTDLLTLALPANTTISTFIKTLLDDTDAATARGTLDVQQLNSNLTALAGLTGAADKMNYFTGPGAMSTADLTSLGRQVLAATTQAALQTVIGSSGGGMSRRQTVLDSYRDVLGRPDYLWSGVVDFAQLRDTGDAISYDYTGSQYAYLAFDGSDSTYWQSATAYGSTSGVVWIGLKNLKRNIQSIKYLNGAANAAVTSIKVQYSTDDGLTWTDIQTTTVVATASTWNEFAIVEYASGSAGLHRIRLLANANPSGAAWTIYSLILQYENVLDVCTTGNAISYDAASGYPVTNAFDNSESTYYAANTNMSTGNHYVGQSGLASAVKAVRYKNCSTASNPKEVILSWKQNVGDAWIDLATIATDITVSAWNTIVVPSYSPSGSHYFAVRPTTNCAATPWGCFEMEFYTSVGNLNITASSTDKLHTTFGAGFSSSGATDYTGEVTADVTGVLTSPVAGRTHFVYQERNSSTGALTYGSTPIVPQYGQAFDNNKHSLLHFDSSTLIDEFGHTWTAVGNGAYSATTPKFGTGKWAGTTGLCKNTTIPWNCGQPFTMEAWWYTTNNALGNEQAVFMGNNNYPVVLFYALGGGGFYLALSSNNSSWDIFPATLSPAFTPVNNTWYKIVLEWDGYYYRVWIGTTTADMRLLFNVKSSTAVYSAGLNGITLGASYDGVAYRLSGGIDEFRMTIGSNRYGWSPVAETAAFGKYDADMHWYDTNAHKMYKGNDASGWTEVQRVFLGEAYCDAQGFTSVVNYALQGLYDTSRITTTATTTTKNHNIGIEDIVCILQEGATINSRTQIMSKDFTIGRKSVSWSAVAGTSLLMASRRW